MNWHFPFFILTTVTLYSVHSQFNSLSLEELGSNTGIQVFNQIIKSRPHENVVVSPHGIASILGMLQLGADGKTKKQLSTVMRYNVNGVGKVLKKINKAIVSKKNKDIVTVANAVFLRNGFKMEVPFAVRNKDVFQCEVQNVNFQDPASASESINFWVKNETRGMIDNLLSPNLIDGALTRLVLVNAVYFKGLWKSRFQPESTKKRTFVAGDGKSYQVPMLAQLSVFRSGSTRTPNGLWYNFIELPYHGESISMLIALPTESSTPLSAIIPHITTKTIDSWMNTMVPKRMQLVLPKFTAVAQTDLKEPLKALGITEMFEPSKANFTKITRSESLHVSHILQKAKIEVSEDGTKASAATTAILIARSSPPWFIVDRPFLFSIRHNPTGAILFLSLRLRLCLGRTTCQHVSHRLWSCVRSKGWENTAPKPTFGTSQDLEIHGLQVPFRVENKRPSGAAPSGQATSMVGTEQSKEMAGLLSPTFGTSQGRTCLMLLKSSVLISLWHLMCADTWPFCHRQ